MKFNFRIVFTGICAYVPIVEDAGHGPADAVRMKVPLIDASDPPATGALDGLELEPHRAFVKFKLKNVKDLPFPVPVRPQLEEPEAVYYFNGDRLTVTLDSDGADANPFSLHFDENNNIDSMHFVPQLRELTPHDKDWRRVRANLLMDSGALPGLAGLAVIEKGTVHCHERNANLSWKFNQTLSDQDAPERGFAARVAVDHEDVETVILTLTSFSGSASRQIELIPAQNESLVEVMVVNVCDDNPLDWSGDDLEDDFQDDDFRWVFEMVQDTQGIRDELRRTGRELPIPRRAPGGSGGRPNRCMGALAAPHVE